MSSVISMKKIFLVSAALLICLLALTPASAAIAKPAELRVDYGNFTLTNEIRGSGVSRYGYCATMEKDSGSSYRGDVKCELQNNAGATLGYSVVYGTYSGSGAYTYVYNNPGDTSARFVLFSTHTMWVNGVNTEMYYMTENGG
ncbi:MAG: hypothetical protein ABFD50_19860 [Smithella sp.]